MRIHLFRIIVFCFILSAPLASANNTFVQAFLENAPLRQIKVEVDGVIIGVTDGNGVVEAEIGTGEHKLYLIDDETKVPVIFSLSADDEVEISIVYSRDPNEAPIVNSQIFEADSSATGFLAGIVTSPTGIPIPDAKISITDFGSTTTDDEGIYSFELPRGLYRVSVSLDGYTPSNANGVRVMSGLGSYAGFKLFKQLDGDSDSNQVKSFEEVVTLGVFNPTDGAENIERYATTVTTAIDSEQLSRFGDSDIAEAITRMVGLSINEGKYANVRGLDGRYISTKFNGILMPSTDPMRRDVQLDLFPSSIVDRIEIQKSFSPAQPATTTGGSIEVHTKGIPDEKVSSFSVSVGTNSIDDQIQTYSGSSHDWKGYDDGKRALPSGALEISGGIDDITLKHAGRKLNRNERFGCLGEKPCPSDTERRIFTLSFDHDYSISHADPKLKQGFEGSFGDRISFENADFGYYFAGSYDRASNYRSNAQLRNTNADVGVYERTKDNVAFNLYGVLGYENDFGETIFRSTLLRSTDDLVNRAIYLNEETFYDDVIIEYVERQLFAQSIGGSYSYDFSSFQAEFDWRAGTSETRRDEPGRKAYSLEHSEQNSLSRFRLVSNSLQQRWSDLDEKSDDNGFDLALSSDFGEHYLTLNLGILESKKDRSVYLYRFMFEPSDSNVETYVATSPFHEDYMNDAGDVYIDNLVNDLYPIVQTDSRIDSVLSYESLHNDVFQINGSTEGTDTYMSEEVTYSNYLSLKAELSDFAIIEAGWRYEKFNQNLSYPKILPGDAFESDVKFGTPYNHSDYYPAVNLTYLQSDNLQFRLGFSETVSYPGLIERSKSVSYDPDTDKKIKGNIDLIESNIINKDFRVEYYHDNGNRFSLALFNKEITDPIERAVAEGSGSSSRGTIEFRNSDYASLKGVELDFNTALIDNDTHHVFFNGNFAKIISEVFLDSTSCKLEDPKGIACTRALQGQSEYLANLQLGYDHYPTEQKITLLINFFNDRIDAPDRVHGPIIEDGRAKIDLNYEKNFSDFSSLKIKAKNITNEPISYSQNNRAIEVYETGASVSASLTYDF
ncbi:MAG: carboxypeptidase regulatory-like domain-containing protein [Porticoccaceae bacterium]